VAEVSPTRTELLAKRHQITIAEEGKNLLKEKRDALLIEFMALMDKVLQVSAKLEKIATEAQYALTLAKAVDGTVAVKSTSFATKGEVLLEMGGSFIMGVPVPEVKKKRISRSILTRGYSITGVSSRVDEAAEKFEEEINTVIEIAGIETKLKRLGEEIQKIKLSILGWFWRREQERISFD